MVMVYNITAVMSCHYLNPVNTMTAVDFKYNLNIKIIHLPLSTT